MHHPFPLLCYPCCVFGGLLLWLTTSWQKYWVDELAVDRDFVRSLNFHQTRGTRGTGTGFCGVQVSKPVPVPQRNPWHIPAGFPYPWHSLDGPDSRYRQRCGCRSGWYQFAIKLGVTLVSWLCTLFNGSDNGYRLLEQWLCSFLYLFCMGIGYGCLMAEICNYMRRQNAIILLSLVRSWALLLSILNHFLELPDEVNQHWTQITGLLVTPFGITYTQLQAMVRKLNELTIY